MKRIIIVFFILSCFKIYSQETIGYLFFERTKITPELIKYRKEKSRTTESYEFIKYKINNEILFNKISEASINSINRELSNRHSNKTSITNLKMYVIKIKDVIYLKISYNPYVKFSQPIFPMKQPAGFVNYKGKVYELIFWDSDNTLFTPTKEIKKITYKKDKDERYVLFENAEVYFQVKGNAVKKINEDTIIK